MGRKNQTDRVIIVIAYTASTNNNAVDLTAKTSSHWALAGGIRLESVRPTSADVGRTLSRRIISTLLHAPDQPLYSDAFVEPFEAAENDLDSPLTSYE